MPTPRIGNLNTERIAHIMSVALNEFAEKDYKNSSFNRIIRNAGMSKGTMYYYFSSKEDLYLTLLNACKKEFAVLKQAQIDGVRSPDEFWKSLEEIIRYALKELESKKSLGDFIRRLLSQESRHGSSPALLTVQEIEDWMSEALVNGQLIGAIRRDLPIELLTNIIWSCWETVDKWHKDTSVSATETGQLLCDLLRRTLGCADKNVMLEPESIGG